jgi:hypothetical protein
MSVQAHPEAMNLIALPIAHIATRRAVEGAHADDRRRPVPRTRRR